MPYVQSDGTVIEKRSLFRLSIIPEILWSVVDFIAMFFDTLINPNKELPKSSRQAAENMRRSNLNSSTFRPPTGSNIKTLPKGGCGPKG